MIAVRTAHALGLATLCVGVVMCGSASSGYGPPCSVIDPASDGRCWVAPRDARLDCDPSARIAEALPRLIGFTHESCGDDCHVLIGPGTEEPTADEATHFARDHELYANALPGVRYVLTRCMDAPNSTACLQVRVDRCTGPTLDVLASHVMRWAKGVDLEAKNMRVVLRVGGGDHPRCQPTDAACGPIPYHHATYTPGADRMPLSAHRNFDFFDRDEHPCTHDGDCTTFGNDCGSWVEGYADEMVSQEWRTYQEEAFCGCVAARCAWFTQ